jgi:membrane protein
VLSVVSGYLKYVGGTISSLMIFIGIVAMVSTSSSVIRTIMGIMSEIQGKSRFKGLLGTVYSIIVSLVFLVVIYASGLIILTGEWFLALLEKYLGFSNLLAVWQWVRFLLLFLLLLVIIFGIYKFTAPKEIRHVRRMPGAFIASVLLVGVSIVFSRLINASVKYAVIYGSLASFIILMSWIYICSIIMIMGNVFNIAVFNKEALREHRLLRE